MKCRNFQVWEKTKRNAGLSIKTAIYLTVKDTRSYSSSLGKVCMEKFEFERYENPPSPKICFQVASLVLSKLIRIYRRRAMYFFSAIATCTSLFCFATCNYVVSHYDNHATDPLSPTVETALKWASLVTACTLVFSVQLGVQVKCQKNLLHFKILRVCI